MQRLAVFSMMFCLLAGCGGGAVQTPVPVYPVSGVVTFKGKPLAGADVTFTSETADRSAFGRTDSDGRYRLTTFSSNDGAVEGKQSVMISKYTPPVVTTPEPEVTSTDYQPPGYGPEPAPPAPTSDIPAKYSKPETSGLLAVVNAQGANEINFELTE